MKILLKGDVTVKGNDPTLRTLFASGDIYGNSHSITGYNGAGASRLISLKSRGTIAMTSGGNYDTLTANCDVRLDGGPAAATVNALRNVCTTGGSSVRGVATANNRITAGGTGYSDDGTGNWVTNGIFQARSDGLPVGQSCRAFGAAADAATNAAPTCPDEGVDGVRTTNWPSFASLRAFKDIDTSGGGSANSTQAGRNINGTYSGNKPTIEEVKPLPEADDPAFNAWQYSGSANFMFYFANGVAKVKVRNVSGISPGVYNVGDVGQIANGTISYDAGARTWTVTNNNDYNTKNAAYFVPGVAWFDGDLYISKGIFYNTFMATGNIKTGIGTTSIYPPNFATATGTIDPKTPNTGPWDPDRFSYSGLCARPNYPTNYCGSSGTPVANYNLIASGVGKYALMAGNFVGGGINSDGSISSVGTWTNGSRYNGGNIYISYGGGTTWVWGYVLAGNGTDTAGGSPGVAGETRIYGKVNSQGYGLDNGDQEQKYMGLGRNTVIDLTKVPESIQTTLLGDGAVGSLGTTTSAYPVSFPASLLPPGNAGRGSMGTISAASVVAGVPGTPRFVSAASIKANTIAAAPGTAGNAPTGTGSTTAVILSASFK